EAPPASCRTSQDRERGWRRRWSSLPPLGVLDRLDQASAFLIDPLLARVGLGERLGELDRVLPDDRTHGRAVGCGTLPKVGEVAEHLDDGVTVRDPPLVHA